MKKIFGWILAVLGGFFCVVGIMCIPAAFTAENVPNTERLFLFLFFAGFAVISGMLCRKGIQLKSKVPATRKKVETPPVNVPETWMTSQYPALYLHNQDDSYRSRYINKLCALGIRNEDAQKLFQFECDIIRKYGKQYLLDSAFTKSWFFGCRQPFFQSYPKEKEDILKEKSLTVSELCKIIDEAEWHFWNSHEKKLSDAVWAEICAWRLKGPGMEFAISYFEMIAETTGVPMDSLASLSNEQGSHLSRYKWR
ncbi:MAG: hypothetical protein J6C98_06035 [Oscillospiraceae bacterium]|nr:hypothetical protein [Oscillospiraceae bacterium]